MDVDNISSNVRLKQSLGNCDYVAAATIELLESLRRMNTKKVLKQTRETNEKNVQLPNDFVPTAK